MSEAMTLPEGWETILDTIRAQLETAVAAANARAAGLPATAEQPVAALRRGELAAGVQALAARAAQIQARTAEADQVLAAGEEFLRWRLAEAESLRERLAAWAARAIG